MARHRFTKTEVDEQLVRELHARHIQGAFVNQLVKDQPFTAFVLKARFADLGLRVVKHSKKGRGKFVVIPEAELRSMHEAHLKGASLRQLVKSRDYGEGVLVSRWEAIGLSPRKRVKRFLTLEDAEEIRRLYFEKPALRHIDLAQRFEVTRQHIGNVINNRVLVS